jgi:hemerythrin-like domain-containing protein
MARSVQFPISIMPLNITQSLSDEHELILNYANHLENILISSNKTATDADFWSKSKFDLEFILEFIRDYSDHLHHAKEEGILFEYMSRPEFEAHCNPVPQMFHEHEVGRELTRSFAKALQDQDLKLVQESGFAWIELIRGHIFKEDNILYPLAEDGLSESDKAVILKLYEKADAENNLTSLKATYKPF